jgi:hypothetical protein
MKLVSISASISCWKKAGACMNRQETINFSDRNSALMPSSMEVGVRRSSSFIRVMSGLAACHVAFLQLW